MTTEFPEALARFDGDVELMKIIAATVSEDAPDEIMNLDVGLRTGDASLVRSAAHALKGMLSTFQEGSATVGLQAVEQASIEGNLETAASKWQDVRSDVEGLLARITAAS